MPLQPNLIERFLIRRGTISGPLLDLSMSTFQFWALIGAMELGLFEHLDERPLDVQELAERTEASERGIERLVHALVPLGYLDSKDGRYSLSSAAERAVPVEEFQKMAPFFKTQLLEMKDAVRGFREAPEDGIIGWEPVQSGEVGRSYQITMRWLAAESVDEVVTAVDSPENAERLLDVGGGHGLYTVGLCRDHPELQGTVLDWPIGLEAARETLEENPDVADRIGLVERDFEKEELPEEYDVAFLGNIVHGVSPEGNQELFQKLGHSTTERGTVAILDQLAGVSGSKFGRGVASLLGLGLFLFSGGRNYEYETLKDWLSEAGFPHVSHRDLQQPGFSLVIARKQPPAGWTSAVSRFFGM
jgi:hypothetical protein